MKQDELLHNPFSLIADFEGDISSLYDKGVKGILPILPLRDMILFPGVVASVAIGRESSRALIAAVARTEGYFGVVCQRSAETDAPTAKDLYPIGVLAKVLRVMELPQKLTGAPMLTVIIQSFSRFELGKMTRQVPFLRAHVTELEEQLYDDSDREFKATLDACRDSMQQLIHTSDTLPDEAATALKNIKNNVFFLNFVCTNLPFSLEEKFDLLCKGDDKERAFGLLSILNRQCQYAALKVKINAKTHEELDRQQKEYFLQQQIKNIQNELGNGETSELDELKQKAETLAIPDNVREQLTKEFNKLNSLNPQNPDYGVQMNYLRTFLSLPWGKTSEENTNIIEAKKTLEMHHSGLPKVKERILEHLAVLLLQKKNRPTILCLYGPPGVGKTSLGRSIAEAMGRKYVRVSLGGIHDEAEIRGHRRTYVGAMPGRIIKGLIKAQTDNPVFVLDEIDKVSQNNYNGDPQSALLEVLDPEQNSTFHDNYLDVDYDLSHVFFIATANSLNTIPRPLLDRMEIIEVEGYVTEEKKEIARKHLVPDALENIDLGFPLTISPAALEYIIENYTRESGVRQLEKQISTIIRKVAYKLTTEPAHPFPSGTITKKDVKALLGAPLFSRDRYQGNSDAGVVTGLAWTAVGGEILFIETSLSRSKNPRLTLTGNLGDVMKESAILALEYIKAHAEELHIDYRIFEHWSVHIHVPEGATPKDGPSAGITIATSIASAVTQRKVRANTAMTGEITLRGRVLPVGGIREKILAAKRAGINAIVLSEENRKDIEEIKSEYLEGMTFHYVTKVQDVLSFALTKDHVEHPIDFTIDDDADASSKEAPTPRASQFGTPSANALKR